MTIIIGVLQDWDYQRRNIKKPQNNLNSQIKASNSEKITFEIHTKLYLFLHLCFVDIDNQENLSFLSEAEHYIRMTGIVFWMCDIICCNPVLLLTMFISSPPTIHLLYTWPAQLAPAGQHIGWEEIGQVSIQTVTVVQCLY